MNLFGIQCWRIINLFSVSVVVFMNLFGMCEVGFINICSIKCWRIVNLLSMRVVVFTNFSSMGMVVIMTIVCVMGEVLFKYFYLSFCYCVVTWISFLWQCDSICEYLCFDCDGIYECLFIIIVYGIFVNVYLYHSLISCSSYLVLFLRNSMSSWVRVCLAFPDFFLYFPPFPKANPEGGT